MQQFEKILLKYSCQRRIDKPKASVTEIENLIMFNLPNDYVGYLTDYDRFEDQIGKEYFYLMDIDEIIETNILYNIVEKLPNTLIIGGNGGSEFIAIELIKQNEYRIVLSPFIDLDKNYHIEIGNSFTDFLVRLDNGKEWFN